MAESVAASIKPIHSLVAAVMAGVGEPDLIVKGGGSPHTYALRPSDAAALQDAAVVFWVGPDIEQFLTGPLERIAVGARAVALGNLPGLALMPYRDLDGRDDHDHDHDHGHGHDHGHAVMDRHVWLDPRNAQVMVDAIASVLGEIDPGHADAFAANARRMSARLDVLTEQIAEELAGVRDRPFVVFHDAYGYFERRFGLSAAAAVTLGAEIKPGARRIATVRDTVRRVGAVCAFAEPQFEPRLLGTIAEGLDLRMGVLDPLGADLPPGPDMYLQLIRNLGSAFRDCL